MLVLSYITMVVLLVQFRGSSGNAIGNEVVGDKVIQLAFMVHRHGERTPDEDELSLSNIQDQLRNLTVLDGLEGLTNVGKRRGYQLGKFIRHRYGSHGLNLISNLYVHDEILVRSTDKDRTKMMAQVAMAAAYPPEVEQQWDEGIGKIWQPIPYSAVPLAEDYLRYYSNCKRFKTLMSDAQVSSVNEELLPYRDLALKLMTETGRNFTENPTLFQTLFDLYKSQLALGLDLPKWAHPLLPQLSKAAKLAYKLYFRNDEMKKIGGGVLLNNFLTIAKDIAAGQPVSHRFRVFSAHDFNLGAFMEVTKSIRDDSIPEYGSAFMLELYKSRSTGQYSVLPVYLKQAGEATETLTVQGCDQYCELSKFQELTKEFVLQERDFYQICGIRTEL